jgi:seryl-tRNA(Sec) selenium transferase
MVPKMFGAKLQLLRKALDEWPHDIHNSEELSALRRIASEADALRKWRNQRIHARVEFIEGTSVLLDDTGRQLPITYDECERQIQVTIRLAVELQTYAVSLVKQAESDARLLEIIQRDLRENRAMAEDE